MSDWQPALLALGSNLGDRLATLRSAVSALARQAEVRTLRCSSIYASEPLGEAARYEFLNAVVELETLLAPRALLNLALAIELDHGRRRGVRWGPRTLDIDLLWYAGQVIDEPGLTVPHPGLSDREFVLRPLADLQPDLRLVDGRTVHEALEELGQHGCLRLSGTELQG